MQFAGPPAFAVKIAETRKIDKQLRDTTLKIIEYRVKTRRAIEPLLIFSPYSDPDVLGSIATDTSQPVENREIAANAILDQLYISNVLFQASAEQSLSLLTASEEKQLRLKGWVGVAILEYLRFYSGNSNVSAAHRILRLQYAASRERDPELRQLFDRISLGDPSLLVGSAAFSPTLAASKLYRQFDAVEHPAIAEVEKPEMSVAIAWAKYRSMIALNDEMTTDAAANGENPQFLLNQIEQIKMLDSHTLMGFLSRYIATLPAHNSDNGYPSGFVNHFRELSANQSDPYVRALALYPVCFGERDDAIAFFESVLVMDEAPLVRLAAADVLKNFCDDSQVRSAMVTAYQDERDVRVRQRVMQSLVSAFSGQPPADVLEFLLDKLRSENDIPILEYAVFVLGEANMRNAAPVLTRLLARSDDVILRARIAEALATMGLGSRLRNVERPTQ